MNCMKCLRSCLCCCCDFTSEEEDEGVEEKDTKNKKHTSADHAKKHQQASHNVAHSLQVPASVDPGFDRLDRNGQGGRGHLNSKGNSHYSNQADRESRSAMTSN